jgi:hypothetical protein
VVLKPALEKIGLRQHRGWVRKGDKIVTGCHVCRGFLQRPPVLNVRNQVAPTIGVAPATSDHALV